MKRLKLRIGEAIDFVDKAESVDEVGFVKSEISLTLGLRVEVSPGQKRRETRSYEGPSGSYEAQFWSYNMPSGSYESRFGQA